ncbi:hypothetical protein GLYMA_06G319250v4 [Glycine max]|nr:hypothetical protein GLYMA_06G319250v4 [Glycine max]KAH1128512.1 hypothetical protein GYH30_016865 [Glycine max]
MPNRSKGFMAIKALLITFTWCCFLAMMKGVELFCGVWESNTLCRTNLSDSLELINQQSHFPCSIIMSPSMRPILSLSRRNGLLQLLR